MSELARRKKGRLGCARFLLCAAITFALLFFIVGEGRQRLLEFMYPEKYSEEVEKYSDMFGVDKYLVYAVIKTESGFDEKARSNVGAKGLMQIMDETAAECNQKAGFGYDIPDDIYNPEVNISLGCYYLKSLTDSYDGDITLAITAYNGGTGNVGKWLTDEELSDGDGGLLDIPFKETKGYVDKVLAAYEKYKEIYEDNGRNKK